MIIQLGRLAPGPEDLCLEEWAVPDTRKELQFSLGLPTSTVASSGYSKVTALSQLISTSRPFGWPVEAEQALLYLWSF